MEVERTYDLERILSLPRRADPYEGLAEQMTDLLRTPNGTMRLRPLQALALHDIGVYGGAFLMLDVGEGKTLVSFLAPYILDAKRPLLLLRANLVHETSRKLRELREHWLIPNNIRVMSFQMLGLVQSARDLEMYAPDLIIVDEAQALKNRDAAVTRRVERYLEAHPDTKFVAMTGTFMRRSIRDFAHTLRWALKEQAPIPSTDNEVDEWARCLDASIENEWERVEVGALAALAGGSEDITAVRQGFRQRLRETPGVVASAPTGTEVDADLVIRPLRYEVSTTIQSYFRTLREEKIAPTGEELWEAAEVWRHARELALGFCQRWDPPAPEEWKAARKAWFQFVRGVLSRSRTWDSPKHVEMACDAGQLPNGALEAWRAVRDSFIPNPVPVWHDDAALKVCAKWMKRPGIVWVKHVPMGIRLSAYTGAKYYGEEGVSEDGEFILDADPSRPIIASVDANKEGRNLQTKYHRNLLTTMLEGSDTMHQLIGRTHRPGQSAATVEVDVLLGCAEHARAWFKALSGAAAVRDTVGTQCKLLIADTESWPDKEEIQSWSGPQWEKELS